MIQVIRYIKSRKKHWGTKYLVHWPDHVVGVKLSTEMLLKMFGYFTFVKEYNGWESAFFLN